MEAAAREADMAAADAKAAAETAEAAAEAAKTADLRKQKTQQRLQLDLDIGSPTGGDVCDVTSSGGPVCFSGQQAALIPPAVLPGLVGRFTFDEDTCLDSSGYGHHGTELQHGPAPAGNGHSALFKTSFATIPNSKYLQMKDFSLTFWLFIVDEADSPSPQDSIQWCPLARKGVFAPESREFASAPAFMYSHATGQLRLSVTTTTHRAVDGEFVDSNARILPNRWVHLAAVHHGPKLLIYVNGILDAVMGLKGEIIPNEHPLYIGGDPFTVEHCRHSLFMDELRVLDHAITPHELQAEAAPALGGADPSFVHLGCVHCSLAEAARSCPATRHICSSLELHTGAYQVARALGWLRAGSHVWTYAALKQEEDMHGAALLQGKATNGGEPVAGLGLCCDGEEAHM